MKKAKPTSIREFAFRNDYDNPRYFSWRSKAKDKKIMEMARLINDEFNQEFYSKLVAITLHKAGYRKQSDTVKEFAEKLTKRLTKEVKDNPEAAASQYKAGLYFAMDLAEQYGKEE